MIDATFNLVVPLAAGASRLVRHGADSSIIVCSRMVSTILSTCLEVLGGASCSEDESSSSDDGGSEGCRGGDSDDGGHLGGALADLPDIGPLGGLAPGSLHLPATHVQSLV